MAKLSTYPKSTDFTGAYLSGVDANSNVTNYNPLFLPISNPVQSAFTTVNSNMSILSSNLGMEATTRANRDNQLQSSIDGVADDLTTETTDRESADSTLQTNIDTVAGNVSTETTNRQTADTNLQNQINTITGGYLTTSTAAATYLAKTDAATTYLTQAAAGTTYLTQANAATTYQTQSGMSAYLTTANAATTYLTQSNAASTYQTQSGMTAYMPKTGGTFTGAISGLTATAGNNTTLYATTAFVSTAITNSLSTFNASLTKASVGLGNVDNTSDVNKPVSTAQQTALDGKVDKTSIGAANGIVPLGSDSKIPATYIPGSIDEIDEFANLAAFPATGATNKLYVALDTEKVYRWSGSTYTEISPSPGSTDAVPEGTTNLYFLNSRAVSALSPTLANYLTTATAASTYQTQSGMSAYLTTSIASSTYLTQSNAASTYQTQSGMSAYLTTSTASSTYLTQSNASSTYLTQSNASSTYATNSNLSNYMPKSGGTFTGAVTVPAGFTVQASSADFGGQINLGAASSGGLVLPTLLQYQGKVLFYEAGGSGRGAYLDWANLSGWASNKILTTSDLSTYATQSYVTGQGYITSSALSGYATQSYVTSQGFATQTYVTSQGYATQSYVTGQGYITSSSLSGYMPKSGGTFTGPVSTNGSGTGNSAIGTATGGLGDLIITGNGTGAAFMAFLRPGVFAAYLGIDTDNQWKVGGWSMGAASYTLWHSGNFTPGNYQAALGFTPVRQGGGANQGNNTIYIGWDGGGLRAQVDSTDLGDFVFSGTLSSYATQSYVNSQGFATQSYVTSQGYATQAYVNSAVSSASSFTSETADIANASFATFNVPDTTRSAMFNISVTTTDEQTGLGTGVFYLFSVGSSVVANNFMPFTNSAGAATGTAGSSGSITMFTGNGAGKLAIENRHGSTIRVRIKKMAI